jgi:hypothetical protein
MVGPADLTNSEASGREFKAGARGSLIPANHRTLRGASRPVPRRRPPPELACASIENARSGVFRQVLFRERNILLVLFRHLLAIARRHCAAVDGLIDLLLPRHPGRLLFLGRLVVLGRRRRRGGGRRCRGCGCRCRGRRCGGGGRRRRCRRGRRIRSGSGGVLGHQQACRHARGHRCGRHNTRKFLHPNPHCRPASREAISVIRRPGAMQPRTDALNRPDPDSGKGGYRKASFKTSRNIRAAPSPTPRPGSARFRRS